ncbi:MAG: hypothetical protein JXP73_17805 [Deltaproteobacteria bacterium]|nr:hypothetical protein [Deltaproteobacteria bacterium]
MARFYLAAAALLSVVLATGCRERNPAYIEKIEQRDAPAGQDTKIEPVGEDAGLPDAATPPVDVAIEDGPVQTEEAGPDGLALDGGISGEDVRVVPDVLIPHDVREVGKPSDVPLEVAAEAGPAGDGPRDRFQARDARDAGDGPVQIVDGGDDGPADAGEVAADVAPVCQEDSVRACASPGNPLVGACRAGKQICTDNAWGPCKEEVLPADGEKCNGVDDDCDGMTDEGCAAECVVVAPSGDDGAADGSPEKPFATLPAALAFASGVDLGGPRRVCVAGGATCGDSNTYVVESALAIPNGARVQGNYALAGAELTYCASTRPPTTALQAEAPDAVVVFDDGVVAATELSGFVLRRYSPTAPGASDTTTSAVKIDGGKNVVLSGIFVTDTPRGGTTYGVRVENGGQATILGSAIHGGSGELAAIGVYVNGGSVRLRDNCDGSAKGICPTACSQEDAVLGIRGRTVTAVNDTTADSSAVYIAAGSPPTSSIVASMLCGGGGNVGEGTLDDTDVATLRCESGGCASVAGNDITGGSGRLAVAVSLAGGGGTIEANAIRLGCGTTATAGVLLTGSSARLRNNRVVGSECTAVGATGGVFYGVRMVQTSDGSEPELHSNDIEAFGIAGECESVGLFSGRASGESVPAGIFRNNIVAAGDCKERVAIYEDENAPLRLIENNDIYPGPASAATTILYRRGSANVTKVADVNLLAGAKANISADPKYAAYPGDLRLTKESPCIDEGGSEGAPASDADGSARPQGAGFDIGAYEFVSP